MGKASLVNSGALLFDSGVCLWTLFTMSTEYSFVPTEYVLDTRGEYTIETAQGRGLDACTKKETTGHFY